MKAGGSSAILVYFKSERGPARTVKAGKEGRGLRDGVPALGSAAKRSPRLPPSRSVTYFEPSPIVSLQWASDDAVLAWLAQQHPAYQETAQQIAEACNSPSVAESERRRWGSVCADCGYNGDPTGGHRWNCPNPSPRRKPPPRSFKKVEVAAPLDEDDDLPF